MTDISETSLDKTGSDAMNAAGDYSAAYCILHTDSEYTGHGMVRFPRRYAKRAPEYSTNNGCYARHSLLVVEMKLSAPQLLSSLRWLLERN
jgi:hypothetical protein